LANLSHEPGVSEHKDCSERGFIGLVDDEDTIFLGKTISRMWSNVGFQRSSVTEILIT